MQHPALEIKNLHFTHADPTGNGFDLRMEDLQLEAGEQVLLVGSSGSGKSTLLQLIAGLIDPAEGRILVGGRSIHDLGAGARDKFRGRSIGMIFQTFNLLDGFSARENILIALMFSDLSSAPESSAEPR